ncbi:DUF3727 domain-containing protein [Cyanobacterium aponinum]|uniref:DUF3727 domain-containing protein n=2 Tax=Cyanobacterium aponinum TaxID=379064 RepID=K9Z5S1_CYAAP|nr:DUF3727 domain-containing protein [Cyanobacterium aponinum]AFZ53920.1 protein of unknown function DUF1292 [Cyanobacterium aponinum PCC 10605]MTF39483.1 DUF3727 domain-containing protein [Cyanobacterium aponinum 0216]
MSSPGFSSDSGQYDDTEIVTIFDDEGRSLDCYIENEIEYDGKIYVLLMPIDLAIVILTEEIDSEDNEYSETVMVEDKEELDGIFDDAKAVLGELNLYLKRTGFILTASGELPPLEENNIISLEIEEHTSEIEPEELQFLASFYSEEQKYNICTPLSPILFIGEKDGFGKINIIQSQEEEVSWILEELLFEDYEDN